MSESLDRLLHYQLEAGRFPGAVVHIERDGRTLARHVVGRLRGDADEPMRADAVFRIASMTKPIVSAAALSLIDEGRLALEQEVASVLPELAGLRMADGAIARPQPTIIDLMRHTSGLGYVGEHRDARSRALAQAAQIDGRLPQMQPAKVLAALARVPLACVPRSGFCYGFSTDVLGLVLERIEGERLGEILRRRILAPLGMHETAFSIDPAERGRLATALPSDLAWHGLAAIFGGAQLEPTPMHSGGGGLCSTLADYLRFARMIVGGGVVDGVRVLSAQSVQRLTTDALEPHMSGPDPLTGPGFGFGLGLAVRRDFGASAYASVPGEVTWSAVFGPVFYVHPTQGWIVIAMAPNLSTRILSRMEWRHAAQSVIAAP